MHRREQILLFEGGYASADVADVLDTAIEDGTYLKAPNGKESNLSEKPTTWAQIRTEPFKEWFGDWELLTKSVKTVYVNNTIKFKNFKDARKWAKKLLVLLYIQKLAISI